MVPPGDAKNFVGGGAAPRADMPEAAETCILQAIAGGGGAAADTVAAIWPSCGPLPPRPFGCTATAPNCVGGQGNAPRGVAAASDFACTLPGPNLVGGAKWCRFGLSAGGREGAMAVTFKMKIHFLRQMPLSLVEKKVPHFRAC